ncbi:MAG: hypothetical protein E6Q89_06995 [Bacteroidia bacterium]|nr:MAG: hypothetical protein E6Q89_06995 [Bacteroidia bacterium]
MIYKYLIILFPNLITLFGFSQNLKSMDHFLTGENNENLGYKFSINYSFNPFGEVFDPIFIDSVGNPYTGMATKLLYPRKTPNDTKKTELDSMCIFEGVMFGYAKKYTSSNLENAVAITYTNSLSYNPQSSNYPFNKYQIEASYHNHIKARKLVFVKITVYKENLAFSCHIDYSKKNIKTKTTIKRISNELGPKYSTWMKHETKFKEKKDLQQYFKLFPEIISQEITDICIRLGTFNDELVTDPVISGNCNYAK